MELVGISDVVAYWRVKMAASMKIPIYCSMPERAEEMRRGGIEISGFLDDLLRQVDVVVDCAPAKIGIKSKATYEGAIRALTGLERDWAKSVDATDRSLGVVRALY